MKHKTRCWVIISLIIFALVGCSYNAYQDPNMQFWDQPAPVIYQSPRQIYFNSVTEPVNYCAIHA